MFSMFPANALIIASSPKIIQKFLATIFPSIFQSIVLHHFSSPILADISPNNFSEASKLGISGSSPSSPSPSSYKNLNLPGYGSLRRLIY